MSDTYISIVPVNVKANEVSLLAEKVKNELIRRKVINQDFIPGSNAMSVVVEKDDFFKSLLNNKLDIIKTRQVFQNGQNGTETIKCPNCSFDIIETNWIDVVEEWHSNSKKDSITCPKCSETNSVTEYIFEPVWGFGELGFTFWNWPKFEDSFILELENLLSRKVKIVHGLL